MKPSKSIQTLVEKFLNVSAVKSAVDITKIKELLNEDTSLRNKRFDNLCALSVQCYNFKKFWSLATTKQLRKDHKCDIKVEDAINVNSEVVEDKVSHIITATWSIPPRWFALFEPSDRLRGSNDDGAYTILRTSISNAKQRCLFAHQAVVNAFGHGPIEEEIADLLNWLGIFNSQSIVECDYGGLAVYLEKSLVENGEPGLNADTSIEDVAKSLAGLAAGDGALAGKGYERLVTRWRRVSSFEQAM